ncbi:MAG: NlpC/P60 family protein [Ancalomicrobiaceae bacterium]|nr:NlpC/P60 family protein [Ancalomicrobiaceae bacterium]
MTEATVIRRADIVKVVREWIGTPYHHQAAVKGAGCDCLGLIRGVYASVTGKEPETPPPYTPDWGETGSVELMIEAASRHLVELPAGDAQPGDVVIFRLAPGMIAKHAAILSGDDRMIHAQLRDMVREVSLSSWWRRRIVAAFAFPGAV